MLSIKSNMALRLETSKTPSASISGPFRSFGLMAPKCQSVHREHLPECGQIVNSAQNNEENKDSNKVLMMLCRFIFKF